MADLHEYFEHEWGATMQKAYMKLMARLGKSAKQVYKEILGVYPG
jgi:hypothetical protein